MSKLRLLEGGVEGIPLGPRLFPPSFPIPLLLVGNLGASQWVLTNQPCPTPFRITISFESHVHSIGVVFYSVPLEKKSEF
jgi:hypothetical protein